MLKPTRSKLEEIFREVFRLPADANVPATQQSSEADWDSLNHVLLMAAVESEFGLEIDAGDSLELTSFDAVARYLEDRGF